MYSGLDKGNGKFRMVDPALPTKEAATVVLACPRQTSSALRRGCRSASYLGEYRTIMNLVRVLPNGREAKLVVDEAIDTCAPIGNLRDDIHR